MPMMEVTLMPMIIFILGILFIILAIVVGLTIPALGLSAIGVGLLGLIFFIASVVILHYE